MNEYFETVQHEILNETFHIILIILLNFKVNKKNLTISLFNYSLFTASFGSLNAN